MNFRKGPAILGVVVAIAAIVVVVVVGGGDDAKTPTTSPTDEIADEGAASGREADPDRRKPGDSTQGGESDPGPQSEAPKPEQPVIELEEGQPVGGVRELAYSPGDTIRFAVDSDVDDEIHFHGYDVSVPVKAGEQSQVVAIATLEGVFEVELEDRVIPIAEVTVSP
ncbi:hypothetical protein HJD18_15730 [Thermoleophilia bacterium SCSIO 60948]|nr:hypothetical protein HJD18_15730 [Thermoleophilia bacterium SCSIO 60948]